jgi:hypothetical protein
VPQQFRSLPLVSKPFEPQEMQDAIEMMLSGVSGGPLARAASSTGRSQAAS